METLFLKSKEGRLSTYHFAIQGDNMERIYLYNGNSCHIIRESPHAGVEFLIQNYDLEPCEKSEYFAQKEKTLSFIIGGFWVEEKNIITSYQELEF